MPASRSLVIFWAVSPLEPAMYSTSMPNVSFEGLGQLRR